MYSPFNDMDMEIEMNMKKNIKENKIRKNSSFSSSIQKICKYMIFIFLIIH